ncbi:conserved hypothetical protein [Trichophyton verrucosum HKI 0517]|uniref:Rho-GAP domain-containing protein n=1 Tax=Trichophyton verrucosum (strain HKI 0517) TaxID=663202 RepID=D4D704_TRIVH|nr:uncharacterized protein TRV_02883 [Trichophyton verrucosum HKI 0517]EFE42359.1 conserved hypothetical protein [Trichophyton verrucosum HKI 0517]
MGLSEAYNYLTSFYNKARRNARRQRRRANTSGDSLRSSSSQEVFHSAVLSPKKVRDSGIPTDNRGESTQISTRKTEAHSDHPPMVELRSTSAVNLVVQLQSHLSEGDSLMDKPADKPPAIPDRSPNRPKLPHGYNHPDAPTMAYQDTKTTNLALTTGEDVYNGMGISSKTSSYTALSEQSNMTVNHDPSKRAFSPFEPAVPVTPSEAYSNPFSDSKTMSEPWTGSRNVLVPLGSSQCFAHEMENSNNSYDNCDRDQALGRGGRRHSVRRSDSSTSSASARPRLIDGSREERRGLIKAQSLLKFNGSARYLGLDVIILKEISPMPGIENSDTPARQSSLLNRLRKVKSNLTVKRKDGSKHGLRRIKTMANINAHAEFGMLEGRAIEDLARLGGESNITFPREYEPGILRLPTCMAAPIHFLLQHVRAERSKDTINRTMRSIRLPSGYVYKCARTKGDAHVQDISTVLRHFLCELPGGILGSSSLYSVLAQIHGKNFTEMRDLRDPGRREYIKGVAMPVAAKVRMITLALLALTTDMQLELICAIFGLLALTADECADRKVSHQYLHPPGTASCDFCITLPTPRTLGRVFGSFLYDVKNVRELQPTVQFKLAEGTQSADVATMLIELWKHISTQLRRWEVFENE